MEDKMIYKAISAIMEEAPAIGKDKINQQQGFKYRGVDDVMNVFQPILAKHHVFVVPEVISAEREERQTNRGGNLIYSILRVKFTFYAEDGSSVFAVVQGEGMDSGDKASNKALAIAFKYALFQVFCIPTEEMKDPDAETPEESKPKRSSKKKTEEEKEKEYRCCDCGTPFNEWTDKSGKTWTAGQLYHMSERKYGDGRARCRACGDKYNTLSKLAAMQNENTVSTAPGIPAGVEG